MVPDRAVVASERCCGRGVGIWFFARCNHIAVAARTGRQAAPGDGSCCRMGDPSFAPRSFPESDKPEDFRYRKWREEWGSSF